MLKKYLIIILSIFSVVIIFQVVGVIQINKVGINQYIEMEKGNKEDIVKLYFSNKYENMDNLARAHAYWEEAKENVNLENRVWIEENLEAFLVEGEYDIDFVYIANEDKSFESAMGIIYEDVNNTNALETVLQDNKKTHSIIEANEKIYLVSAFPFGTDEGLEKEGALVLGNMVDETEIEELKTLIGQDLLQDHLHLNVNSDHTLNEEDVFIVTIDSQDETLYVSMILEYQFANYLNNTIKNHLVAMSLVAILIIIGTVLFFINRFKKELDVVIHQLNNIDVSSDTFTPITITKSPEFNEVIHKINELGAGIEANYRKLVSKNIEIAGLLSTASEINDPYTSKHSDKVAKISVKIGKQYGIKNINRLELCAELHDIGKVFIQHNILNKQEQLSDTEFARIKEHPELGAQLLNNLSQFEEIKLGVLHHHERFDGKGYPNQLKGKEIPIYARIISVADVYDALTSDRPYRKAFNKEKALKIMKNGRLKLFDPEILDIFFDLIDKNEID